MTDSAPASTRAALPATLIDRYRNDGYLHVRAVLTEAEVEEFHADATSQLEANTTVRWDAPEAGTVMDWVAEPEHTSAAMRRLALHQRITAIAEQLARHRLRMFKTELLRKANSGSAPTPAHIDGPVFPIEAAPVTLTAWVALVDVPVERGCLTFFPGSHHWPEGSRPDAATVDPFGVRPELHWWPRVTVPLRAGDCTFHHADLVHQAGANATGTPRISLATVYMDADAVYRPNPDAFFQDTVVGLEPGQPMDTARYPLIGANG
ncbi:phytanoyl-CoA dioxygenase family protein [Mycolicibacterium sp. XJ870]